MRDKINIYEKLDPKDYYDFKKSFNLYLEWTYYDDVKELINYFECNAKKLYKKWSSDLKTGEYIPQDALTAIQFLMQEILTCIDTDDADQHILVKNMFKVVDQYIIDHEAQS